MGEMAAVGQVQSHNSAVGLDDGRVDGEVSRRAGQRLHIHSPLLGIQSEHLNYFFFYFLGGFCHLEGSLLTQQLHLVNEFVSAVISEDFIEYHLIRADT